MMIVLSSTTSRMKKHLNAMCFERADCVHFVGHMQRRLVADVLSNPSFNVSFSIVYLQKTASTISPVGKLPCVLVMA